MGWQIGDLLRNRLSEKMSISLGVVCLGVAPLADAGAEDVRPWLLGGPKHAFAGAIVAERPSFSTSPDATPPGRLNAEAGLELRVANAAADAGDAVGLPLSLVRLGLLERFELRAGWSGWSGWPDGPDAWADPSLGFKWQLNEGGSRLPRAGLIVEAGLPIGDGTGTDRASLLAALAWSHPLTSAVGLFGTSTWRAPALGESGFDTGHSVGVSLAFARRWSVFSEYYATADDDAVDTHTVDAGFVFQPTENLQLDLNGGFRVDGGAGQGFVGTGLAWRY